MTVREPLPGACDSTRVFGFYNKYEGQLQAVPPMTLAEIQLKLTNEVQFLKSHPKYTGSVIVECVINCKGELILCKTLRRGGTSELRQEVIAVFKTLKTWTPGRLNGEVTDCVEDFRVEIKNGVVSVSSRNDY